MQLSDILILSGARTPIGSFGGALASQSPAQLGTVAATATIQRAGVDAAQVDVAVFGHIITTTQTSHEFIDTTLDIHDLLLTGIKWMAF